MSADERTKNGTAPGGPDDRTLYETAVKMRERSYAPYSHFRVGAALLAKDGTAPATARSGPHFSRRSARE